MKYLILAPVLLLAIATPSIAAPPPGPRVLVLDNDQHVAYLGVGLRDVTDETAQQLKLKEVRGAEVIAVDHDGPSAQWIREHDVILELNHEQVSNGEQVRRILRQMAPGKKAELLLSRDGNVVNVQVVLGDRSAVARFQVPDVHVVLPDLSNLDSQMQPVMALGDSLGDMDVDVMLHGALSGALVESVGPQLAHYFGAKDGSGVLVKEVRDNTAAAHAGMRAGDLIIRAAGQPVPSRLEWDRRLHENAGKSMDVVVLRNHAEIKLTLRVPAQTSGKIEGLSVVESDPVEAASLESLQGELAKVEASQQGMAEAEAELQTAQEQLQPEIEKQLQKAREMQPQIQSEIEKAEKAIQPEVEKQLQKAQADVNTRVQAAIQPELEKQLQKVQEELQREQPKMEEQMRKVQESLDKLNMQ